MLARTDIQDFISGETALTLHTALKNAVEETSAAAGISHADAGRIVLHGIEEAIIAALA